jgi:hypothetical protein
MNTALSLRRKPAGFLVWNPAKRMPTHRHDTFASAEAERARLQAACPDEIFWVMAPVRGEKTASAAKAFSDGKAEGMAQARAEIMLAEARTDRFADDLADLRRTMERVDAITRDQVEHQATAADCLCWFDGFNAAYAGRESYERPVIPDRDKIRKLNAALQSLLRSTLDEEIPF